MGKSILIVDDSATMRKAVMRSLRQAGVDAMLCHEAAGGGEGLQALAHRAFDLVLSDIDLPDMSGVDFVTAIGGRSAPPPVVVIATEGSEDAVARAVALGARGSLTRPVTAEQIQRVLGPLLE